MPDVKDIIVKDWNTEYIECASKGALVYCVVGSFTTESDIPTNAVMYGNDILINRDFNKCKVISEMGIKMIKCYKEKIELGEK